ncbi:MAG TPA: hypothetical protein VF988_06585, partial [Verrucomicrobiae bacterium]
MKPEVVFGLDNALWPALLTNGDGAILMFNAAARTVFGSVLDSDNPQLEALWSPANGSSMAEFLAQWEKAPAISVDLKFRTENGTDRKFSTTIAVLTSEDDKWYVLQLLPAAAETPAPAKAPDGAADQRNATGDAALKQKLECVLQLARTVSLDFNNALTGVLAHTSLVLGKAEPNHPW